MPCDEMHTIERSLVRKYQGKPFAVLGVKIDGDLETLRRSEKQKFLTWRSIWDGGRHDNSRAYNIEFTPTLFLIDHRGRQARSYPGRPDERKLGQDIDKLVNEAEKEVARAAD